MFYTISNISIFSSSRDKELRCMSARTILEYDRLLFIVTEKIVMQE